MELKILSATSCDLFLQPRLRSRPDAPAEDDTDPRNAYLQVIIQLSIPKDCTPPAKLLSLAVSLVGYESIGFPRGGFEQNQPYCSKKTIPSAVDLKLQPGSLYQFETTFAVDHNTAPYQRGKYGRHHQKVQVKATFPGLLAKKTLTAERNFFFVQTVAQTGSLPYYYVHRSAAEALGPIFFGVRTQHLTVGGYLRITLSLASASPTVRLHGLQLSLLQQTTLKSRIRRNYSEQPPAERFVFFEADEAQLKECITTPSAAAEGPDGGNDDDDDDHRHNRDGEHSQARRKPSEVLGEGNWITRLPNDSEARASSLPGSDVAIHMAHGLELTIQYSDPTLKEGELQTYRTSWGLILPSCACRWQSMRLPSYTPHDADPVPTVSRDFWTGRNEHESVSQCVCGQTLEALLRLEEEAKMAREPEAESEIWRQMLDLRLEQRLAAAARGRSRAGGTARSASQSPAVSRDISRRNSIDDWNAPVSQPSTPGASGSSGYGTGGMFGFFSSNNGGSGRTTPTTPAGSSGGGGVERGRSALRPSELQRGPLLDDEDELEFELQARELLEGLEGQQWQRQWDRLNEQRQRRAKARNEYVNLDGVAAAGTNEEGRGSSSRSESRSRWRALAGRGEADANATAAQSQQQRSNSAAPAFRFFQPPRSGLSSPKGPKA